MSNDHDLDETSESNGGEFAGENFNADGSDAGDIVVTAEKQPVNRGTLVMFGILVLAAAGLFVMYHKSGPRSAGAAVAPETVAAKKTISTFLSGGDASFKSMEVRLKNTEKVVQQFRTYPSATQMPLSSLQTNPFRQHAAEVASPKDNEGLSEAALKKKKEEERLAAKKSADALMLQSIVCSDVRKACMINSQLYREGETCGDFVVESISPSTVTVKTGNYRFELSMQ